MSHPKQIAKRIIDLCMVVLLPFLMMEALTGQEIHEWLGTGMLVLFLMHQVLNAKWWKSLCRGRYTPSRALATAVNLLLLIDILALFASGIMMSGFVFDFLPISGGMAAARSIHLFASHWGLILMSAHLGLHMEMLMGVARRLFRLSEKNAARTWVLRLVALAGSAYGIYAFVNLHMADYLLLRAQFVMFDEAKPPFSYFAENAAMIVLFAAVAHYLGKLLRRAS